MKYIILLAALIGFSVSLSAQSESKWPEIDASTLDAVYFPAEVAWRNYLETDQRDIKPKMKLLYSRPTMNDRKIFGELIKYGEEWRLGANEATLITFYQPVSVGGTTINAGTYSLFATVEANAWTFHVSSETNIWGNVNRDMAKTIASAEVKSMLIKNTREALTMTFQEIDAMHTNLVVEWENTRASMPIEFNPILMDGVDQSPMDIVHFPGNSAFTNYAKGENKNIKPRIQVTYSRPQKKGREVFGEMIKVGNVWRIGANEATEIVFHEDVMVGVKEVKKGRYSMFAKLYEGSWDLILSKDYPIWGAANRDESKDATIVSIPVTLEDEVVEALSIIFEEQSSSLVNMVIAWDQTRATVPIYWK